MDMKIQRLKQLTLKSYELAEKHPKKFPRKIQLCVSFQCNLKTTDFKI